jgi:hypothetical protein
VTICAHVNTRSWITTKKKKSANESANEFLLYSSFIFHFTHPVLPLPLSFLACGSIALSSPNTANTPHGAGTFYFGYNMTKEIKS